MKNYSVELKYGYYPIKYVPIIKELIKKYFNELIRYIERKENPNIIIVRETSY